MLYINNTHRFANDEIIICGDGRCDSPGSSAKFCTYSLMEPDSGAILHCETIDKREVHLKSPNMECEGLKRGLLFLESNGVKIKEITTDASISVISFLGKIKLIMIM